jgi:hypothetical protein
MEFIGSLDTSDAELLDGLNVAGLSVVETFSSCCSSEDCAAFVTMSMVAPLLFV